MSVLKTYIDGLDRLFVSINEKGQLRPDSYGIHTPNYDPEAGKTGHPIKKSKDKGHVTISLSGSAGTGKSIVALHFASAFLAEQSDAVVIYVSTDLSFHVAEGQYRAFGLETPRNLLPPYVPLGKSPGPSQTKLEKVAWKELGDGKFLSRLMKINELFPSAGDLLDRRKKAVPPPAPGASSIKEGLVYFVDMHESATGDDWSYLERFMSKALPLLAKRREHILLVIDAVEGLETLSKQGTPPTRIDRRQRLGRLLEFTSKSVNIVFTLEVTDQETLAEEEFVADVAIHMRRESLHDDSRITLEIPKARGMYAFPRRHEFQIRSNKYSYTDGHLNEDDVKHDRWSRGGSSGTADEGKNYALLIPNLATIERRHEQQDTSGVDDFSVWREAKPRPLAFGIPLLDEMLAAKQGLPSGGIHAVIGENHTHKSELAAAFLSQARFRLFETAFLRGLERAHSSALHDQGEAHNWLSSRGSRRTQWLSDLRAQLFGEGVSRIPEHLDGVAVFFFTGQKITSMQHLIALSHYWLEAVRLRTEALASTSFPSRLRNPYFSGDGLKAMYPLILNTLSEAGNVFEGWQGCRSTEGFQYPRRYFLRRLPNRPTSKEALYYIISENIKWAIVQQIIIDATSHNFDFRNSDKRNELDTFINRFVERFPEIQYKGAWKVRVGFDDVSSILSAVSDENDRNSLIKSVIDLCRLTAVTALFTDVQPGGPLEVSKSPSGLAVRTRTDTSIYTWHVPYGSGSKVAIAVVPPVGDAGKSVDGEFTQLGGDRQVVVRELRRANDSLALQVDRSLELYLDVIPSQGKQLQDLTRVPLRLLIAGEGPLWNDDTFARNCRELLCGCLGGSDDILATEGNETISVVPLKRSALERYVNYSFHPSEAKTVVVMVDEFWSMDTKTAILRPQRSGRDRFLELDHHLIDTLRIEKFDKTVQPPPIRSDQDHYRLVPFSWNFGLSLFRRNAWHTVSHRVADKDRARNFTFPQHLAPNLDRSQAIRDTIDVVCEKIERLGGIGEGDPKRQEVTQGARANAKIFWHDFLAACEYVSQEFSTRKRLEVFELDLPDSQSLTCFLLEVWFSTYVWFRAKKSLDESVLNAAADQCLLHFKMQRQVTAGPLNEGAVPDPGWIQYQSRGGEKSLISTIEQGLERIRLIEDEIRRENEAKRNPATEEESAAGPNAAEVHDATAVTGVAETGESGESVVHHESGAVTPVAPVEEGGSGNPPVVPQSEEATDPKAPPSGSSKGGKGKSPALEAQTVESADLVLTLYLSLIMLAQVIKFDEWDFDDETLTFKPRVSFGNAVAGRYWYTTATSMLRSRDESGDPFFDPNDPLLPTALPGFFSNRGDWQLAVLSSSRSRFLGELAIDELSRTKAAMIRLQTGVGLPMLDFKNDMNGHVHSNIRTGLPSPYGGKTAAFSYDYLRAIAPLRPSRTPAGDIDGFPGHSDFHPIYRSEIRGYLQEHALFMKAMCRLLVGFSEYHRENSLRWIHFHEVMQKIDGKDLKGALQTTTGIEEVYTICDFHTWEMFTNYLRSLEPLMDVARAESTGALGDDSPPAET